MIAPALPEISSELSITSDFMSQFVLSVFVLAFAVGPLLLGPLSEIYGRVLVLQISNLFYLVFNTACGLCQSQAQILVFRFLAGMGGSAPLAVFFTSFGFFILHVVDQNTNHDVQIGGAVLGDIFTAEERGKSIAVYSLAPLLGPAIGPLAGGLITEHISWRWIFYVTSIADAVIQVIGLFLLQETYAPVILQRKANKMQDQTGNPHWHSDFEGPERHGLAILGRACMRPFRLLFTQPIVQVLALVMAYLYGLLYIILSVFPTLWTSPSHYNESVGIGGLNYLSLGIGFIVGVQICAPVMDKLYHVLKNQNGGVGKPEFRIPLLALGSLIIPGGILLYGWTAKSTVFWLIPNIGMALFTMGSIMGFQAIQAYLIDTYTSYVASALAAIVVLRSFAGFGFPLFAPYLFQKLDYGWGSTLFAFLAIAMGLPVPILLWMFGEKLRKVSQYAID